MRFKNNVGYVVNGGTTFSWFWCLLFGCFYFAFKGVWIHAVISFGAVCLTGVSWLIYPFFAHAIVNNHYGKQGWTPLDGGT